MNIIKYFRKHGNLLYFRKVKLPAILKIINRNYSKYLHIFTTYVDKIKVTTFSLQIFKINLKFTMLYF